MQTTLADELLSSLSQLVAIRTGLNFPPERWIDLERGIAAAAPDFNFADTESCARWLLSAPLTRHMNEVLACHLSIGETYFFRERQSLDILAGELLPQLMQTRRQERRLRIWSAGCSTGEEAYTIAILLDRLMPGLRDWHLTILATDFNPKALRKAAQGIYGDWSFRDAPAWLRERYFTRLPDGRYEIIPRIRQMVMFSYLNLADDVYPSLTNNTSAMDVVLCRNVLMYFTAQRAGEVVAKLYRAMVDGGWLIVSPAEASNELLLPFSPVEYSKAVLYRKRVDDRVPLAGYPLFSERMEAMQMTVAQAVAAVVIAASGTAPDADADAVPALAEACESWPLYARRCADQGKLDEALAWCDRAIAADKMNPTHHYLHATVLQEQGQHEAAIRSLQRALYLEPRFVLAHFALGNLHQSSGRYADARRCFVNVQELLRDHPASEILPQADGLTAERLAEIVAALLDSLPEEAATLT